MSEKSARTTLLFDLQRSSFQDGPGIRTTVFLKGCPLRCRWCHNPESQRFQAEWMTFPERCTDCGRCRKVCPAGAAEGPRTNLPLCTACGACAAVCPVSARILKGQPASVQTILEVVRRDEPFYRASGGGLTVSGGEPLSHPGFLAQLLSAAHREGIHTCVETCGFAPWSAFSAILQDVDLFLFDWKMTDPARHLAWTGQDNRLIRENLDKLLDSGAPIVIRAPLIPGVNDDADHLDMLIRLSQNPGIQGVEVLPWHRMGVGKRQALAGRPCEASLSTPQPELQSDLQPDLQPDSMLEHLPDTDRQTRDRWQAYWTARGGAGIRFA